MTWAHNKLYNIRKRVRHPVCAAACVLTPASCCGAGRRDDRKQARLKYLVADWGMPKFRSVVEQYLGKKFEPFRCVHPERRPCCGGIWQLHQSCNAGSLSCVYSALQMPAWPQCHNGCVHSSVQLWLLSFPGDAPQSRASMF